MAISARPSLPNPYVRSKSSALRPYAAGTTFRGLDDFREVDTFNPLRLVDDADANGADWNAETRVARKAAIGAAETFWLTLIAALVAWAVSPGANPSRGSTGSSPRCVFGKGGVICNASAIGAQKMAMENADPCLSLGKGVRYCPPAK